MWFLLIWFLAAPTLVGHVTDSSGKPVSGADVRVIPVGGTPIAATTDSGGRFRVDVTGKFQLEIRHAGYRTVQSSPNELSSDGVFQIEISLLPGTPDQIERVDLQVENPDVVADRETPGAREGLPKADRLFGLRGGVNVTGIVEGSGQEWIAASGNVFTSSSMATGITEISDFSAALGASGVSVDDLPAGQSVFHGSAYYFHRNDALNARNYFDPPNVRKPPFKYHFFGGDVGGGAGENTHFYAQYWGLRFRQSITRAATVPDPAWLNGDFSGVAETILDPETGFPFSGNRIPVQRFDPLGLALARLYPAPNVAGTTVQNYRAVGTLATVADGFGLRVDRRVASPDEGSIEYQFSRDRTADPFNLPGGITNLPSFGVNDGLQTHSLRLSAAHVFSATLIQQLRLSVNYLKQPRTILQSGVSAPVGPAILITGVSNLGYAANLPQARRDRSYEGSGEWSLQRARSSTRFGGEVRSFSFHGSIDLYSRGQFQFTGGIFAQHPFANLLLGLPANALRLEGDTSRNFQTWVTSAFVQHDWQVLPRLTVNAGLRYDFQTPFSERDRRVANFNPQSGQLENVAALYGPDRNNWGPRAGIAWQGPHGVAVRSGYGIFYDTLSVGDSLFLLGLNPPLVRFVLENNGPVLPQFTLGSAFGDTVSSTPPSIFSASRHLPNPYLQLWSLSLQKTVARDMAVELSYFGQKGTRLRRQVNLNQPPPGLAATLDERRPYPNFKNIFQFENSASSIAHAAEIRIVRRMRSGVGFAAAYRLSKAIDDATLISTLPQDSHNLAGERGLSDFDVRQRLVFSATVNLPRVPVVGGWQLQGIGTLQSGMPLSAVLGTDIAGAGSPIVNRPDLVRDPRIENPSAARFFDPGAFQVPPAGRFGNSGRNVIIGPGMQNLDLALTRTFRISDFTRLQFRADAYNALNHANFVAPPSMQNLADSPDFGALFVARSPRVLQFGLKFLW